MTAVVGMGVGVCGGEIGFFGRETEVAQLGIPQRVFQTAETVHLRTGGKGAAQYLQIPCGHIGIIDGGSLCPLSVFRRRLCAGRGGDLFSRLPYGRPGSRGLCHAAGEGSTVIFGGTDVRAGGGPAGDCRAGEAGILPVDPARAFGRRRGGAVAVRRVRGRRCHVTVGRAAVGKGGRKRTGGVGMVLHHRKSFPQSQASRDGLCITFCL